MRTVRWLIAGVLVVGLATVAVAERPSKRPPDDVRGKELYDRHCVQCHGAENDGKGPAAVALVVPVPALKGGMDLSSEAKLDAAADLVLAGKGHMPAFEQSFDRYDARRLLKYMAGLPESAKAAEAEAAPAADTDDANDVEP